MKLLLVLTLGLSALFLTASALGANEGALAMAIVVGGLGLVVFFR